MSKFDHSTGQVSHLLKEIADGNKDASLTAKIHQCYDVANGMNEFVETTCSPESEIQKKIVRDTETDPKTSRRSRMLSGKLVGQLLKMVAEMTKAKRILEIGMFTGYSAVTFAETAFCEEVVSLDIDANMETFVKARIKGTPLESKILIMIGPAKETLPKLKQENKGFDLVFLDADKSSYLHYYQFILDNNLLNENGVFLCDNILWYNDTYMEQSTLEGKALNTFVKFVQADERVEQLIFPFRDGVMLIKRKPNV